MNPESSANQSSGDTGSCLRLDPVCTIREAADIKQRLLEHLDAAQPLLLDASGVEKIDTAGVQLIVGFSLDCLERGTGFRWAGRSAAVDRAISLLGVAPLVGCPGMAPPVPTPAATAEHREQE